MKLASFISNGRASYGIIQGDSIIDLGTSGIAQDLRSALADPDALKTATTREPDLRLADVTLIPPVPNPSRILCAGLNYASHIKETGREIPNHPIIFTRFPSSQVGHQEQMICPKESEQFDYEGELAVVIGKHCRYVKENEWESVIAGYSCYNDGSVRDWQRHSHQYIPGKNFYRSGAFDLFSSQKTRSQIFERLS